MRGDLASEPPCKRSKTHQHSYDAKTRAQIDEYTYNNGPAAAVRHFSMLLVHHIPESTTRKFRDAYVMELKKQRKVLHLLCKSFLLSPEEDH